MGSLEKTIPWVKAVLCMTGYCLWCLENCVKYMSKNAYIQIALTNKSFCPAAFDAFTLILKNAHRFGFATSIGFVYMLFGCIFITSTTCAGTYFFLTNYDGLLLTSPIPTTVVMGLIACAIGFQFLSIFSYSQDAILQSFLLDEELRLVGNMRPDHMQEFSQSLSQQTKNMCGCC